MKFTKKTIAVLLVMTFIFSLLSLAACNDRREDENSSTQNTEEITRNEENSSEETTTKEEEESSMETTEKITQTETETVTEVVESFPPTLEQLASMDYSKKNYVIVTDQRQTADQMGAVVIFDLDKASEGLDDAEVWRYARKDTCFRCPSGVKFRTGTIYGDVVLICCSGGYAGVISYPEGEELWHVENCGSNPHSIEILPDGSIVTGSSSDGQLRIYSPGAIKYLSVELEDAHAVLWDPTYECVWALEGTGVLHAYKEVITKYGKSKLEEIKKYTLKGGAHECTQDFSDPDYLFVCVYQQVYRVNKNTGAFTVVTSAYCKGYGKNLNGTTIYTAEDPKGDAVWRNDSYASWCTPVINAVYKGSSTPVKYRSEKCAFYKAFVFYGGY